MSMKVCVILLLFLSGCRLNYLNWYTPSDPEKIKEFMVKYNILRYSCDGSINQDATIYALVDWTRLNFAHSSGVFYPEQKSVMQLIEEGEERGYVLVDGCDGTADFYSKVLGSVGIETVTSVLNISQELHISVNFPKLDRSSLHADNLHSTRFSRPTSGIDLSDIPSDKLLAPIDLAQDGKDSERRRYYEDLVGTYRPAFNVFFRAMAQGYGKFYTAQEIADFDSGKKKDSSSWSMGVLGKEVLMKLDQEIDRLGGPQKTVEILDKAIIYQDKNTKLIRIDSSKKFPGECTN